MNYQMKDQFMKKLTFSFGGACALLISGAVASAALTDNSGANNSQSSFSLDPAAAIEALSKDANSSRNSPGSASSSNGANSATTAGASAWTSDAAGQTPDYACACGCGVFDVATEGMLPRGLGGMLYIEYDYQNQNVDMLGDKRAPASANPDKKIATSFYTAGLQYYFDRAWGFQIEVPYDDRQFKTTGGATGNDIITTDWSDLGDIRIHGLYSGFFPDQSAGVDFGFKLPTGKWGHNDAYDDVDRDSELGAGGTDLLLGGYYRNNLTTDGTIDYFIQGELDVPMFTQDQYRPGVEWDSAAGVYLNGLRSGHFRLSPIAQVIYSVRGHDSGANAANPTQSGYERILLSPGLELDVHPFTVYADVELPAFQTFHGPQLAASWLAKVIVSYHF